MNINISANYDKIPNITNQDMQEKPNCYKQKVSWTTYKGLQRGINITVLIPWPLLAHLSYAQDELLWSLRPSSIRACVCPLTFSNNFSSEAAEPILLKFHVEPP